MADGEPNVRGGLRLMECLRLVSKMSISPGTNSHPGRQSAKDRITMLPESVKAKLQETLWRSRNHERDLASGGAAFKCLQLLTASSMLLWTGVAMGFPQENRWVNLQTKEQGRHHLDESLVQKAVKKRGNAG